MGMVSGGGVPGSWSPWTNSYFSTIGGVASSLTFGTDGGVTGGGSGTSQPGQVNGTGAWWYPILPGIGSYYWIRATLTAGTAPDVGTFGTWQALSTARVWGWNTFNGVATKTCTITWDIAADAAGSRIVLNAPGNIIKAQSTG